MELDPKHLATLHIIRESGSLTVAANQLNTSQPALSRLVTDLEIRLGAILFDRKSRPWRMTALGTSLAAQGSAVRLAIERADHALDQFQGGTEGLIKLGGTPYLSEAVLPPVLAAFQRTAPSSRIDQSLAYTSQLLRWLRNREIDLAVVPLDTTENTAGLHMTRLLKARNIVVCRMKHPLTKLRTVSPQRLFDYRWIAPPADSPLAADMNNVINKLGSRQARVAYAGGTVSSVAQVLEQSDCLAVLPDYLLRQLSQRYSLTALSSTLSTPTRTLALFTHEDDVRSHLLTLFLEFLERELKLLDQ